MLHRWDESRIGIARLVLGSFGLGGKVFDCPTCGVVMDCDVNGSRNILLRTVADMDDSAITLVVKEVFPAFVPDRTTSLPPEGA